MASRNNGLLTKVHLPDPRNSDPHLKAHQLVNAHLLQAARHQLANPVVLPQLMAPREQATYLVTHFKSD